MATLTGNSGSSMRPTVAELLQVWGHLVLRVLDTERVVPGGVVNLFVGALHLGLQFEEGAATR